MTTIKIEIKKSYGMLEGYNTFIVTVTGAEYKDKNIYNHLHMTWDRDTKTWTDEGHINGTADEVEQIVRAKLSSIKANIIIIKEI